jgi:anti-sigma B factor antagonist
VEISIADGPLAVDATVSGERATVTLRGDLDMAAAPRVRDLLATVQTCGARRVVVVLDGCTFLDSTGLAVLVSLRRRCRLNGGDVILRAPTAAAMRLLAAAGMLRLFRIELPGTAPLRRIERVG